MCNLLLKKSLGQVSSTDPFVKSNQFISGNMIGTQLTWTNET